MDDSFPLKDPPNRVRRLSTHTQPVLDSVSLEHHFLFRFCGHRVVYAQLFEHSSIARSPFVYGGQTIRSSMAPTDPLQSKAYCQNTALQATGRSALRAPVVPNSVTLQTRKYTTHPRPGKPL